MAYSFNDVLRELNKKHAKHNALYFSGDTHIIVLRSQFLELNRSIRKQESNKQVLGSRLANLFLWTATYSNTLIDLPIVEALSEKFPIAGCSYCKTIPCICTFHDRNDREKSFINHEQLQWTIRQWQTHNENVYGKKNQEMSIHQALNRLDEELDEVVCAHHLEVKYKEDYNDVVAHRNLITLEFADVFQWIFALSNILGIDLEREIYKYYL